MIRTEICQIITQKQKDKAQKQKYVKNEFEFINEQNSSSGCWKKNFLF